MGNGEPFEDYYALPSGAVVRRTEEGHVIVKSSRRTQTGYVHLSADDIEHLAAFFR